MAVDAWYYTRDGKNRLGPFPFQQLVALANAGQLLPGDMVRQDGAPRWQPASQFPALHPPKPMTPAPNSGPGAGDVVAAGVLVGAAAVSALASMNNPGNVRHPRLLNLLQEAQALHNMGLLTAAEFIVIRDIVLGHGAIAQPMPAQQRGPGVGRQMLKQRAGARKGARGRDDDKVLEAKNVKGDFKDDEVLDAVEIEEDNEILDDATDADDLDDVESNEDADDVVDQDDAADDLDDSGADDSTDDPDDSAADDSMDDLDDLDDPDPLGEDMGDDLGELGDDGTGGDDVGGDADLGGDDLGGADFGADDGGGGGMDFGGDDGGGGGGGGFDFGGFGGGDE